MTKISSVDATQYAFDIMADRSISPRKRKPGPPERVDGITVGTTVTMDQSAPYGGEVHPDGDESLYVLSRKIRVTGDSAPNGPIVLGAGESCIVKAGEWHTVEVIDETRLLHITPGPNGDHRPLRPLHPL